MKQAYYVSVAVHIPVQYSVTLFLLGIAIRCVQTQLTWVVVVFMHAVTETCIV
jgi:hypothetical protein